ncbi:Uncharacterised protein [Shigella sonnei]|nr:Uncharacterised protein [Shigella sonnei]
MQNDFCGVVARCRYFGFWRTFWHHHFTVDTQHRAGERNPLRMVARRTGHHAFAFFRIGQ